MNYKPSKNSGFIQFDVMADLFSKSNKTLSSQSGNESQLSIYRQDNVSPDLANCALFLKSGHDSTRALSKTIHNRGFTLVELMVTVAIVGILTSVGVPSFIEMINQNRASGLTNHLAASLNLARSEAIKRGLPVTVCKSANITANSANITCSTTDSWHWQNGWLIFVDNKGTPGTYDYNNDPLLSDTLLKIGQPSNSFTDINATATLKNFISYSPSGMSPSNGSFSIDSCVGGKQRKIIIISTGRIRLSKETCP